MSTPRMVSAFDGHPETHFSYISAGSSGKYFAASPRPSSREIVLAGARVFPSHHLIFGSVIPDGMVTRVTERKLRHRAVLN